MNRKSIIKKIKKHKYSILSTIFVIIFISMIFSNTNHVIATENYSNYLYNQELNVYNDRAMILNELAENSNNYRNYFDSGFIFPAKLSNQMFNAFTTDYTQYGLNQIYLDNLDNNYAFKSNNISENIYTQQNINITENDDINGTVKYINQDITYNIVPDSDITTQWNRFPDSGNHFDKVNIIDTSTYIHENNINQYEKFTLNNSILNYKNIDNLKLVIRYYTAGYSGSDYIWFRLYDDISYNYKVYFAPTHSGTTTITYNFYDVNLNNSQIDNMKFETKTMVSTATHVRIYYIYVECTMLNVNYTLLTSDSFGSGNGLFHAEYTFTDDIIGGNPTDWTLDETGGTVNIADSLDGHSKIVELHDTGGVNKVSMTNTFTETAIGTVEIWSRVSQDDKYFFINIDDGGKDNSISLAFRPTGQIAYYTTVYNDIMTYSINTWYHFRIEFDCNNDWHLWINDISKDDGSGYGFRGNPNAIDRTTIRTFESESGVYGHIDAIDYKWSNGYSINRNYYDISYLISIEFESNIEYLNNELYAPIFLNLYSEICLNVSENIDIYIYNYDLEVYDFIYNIDDFFEFNLYNFKFNESGYYRHNKFKIQMNSSLYYTFFDVYIKDIYLNITYIKINELGYHDLSIKLDKQKDDTTYIGYSLFEILIYNSYFLYRYSEINELTDNYITNWFNISYNSIETFEINLHIRYGLNTLDIEITNILVDIYIDSINVLNFLEQDRKYFLGKHYKSEFNYTCNNRNYLNFTGIIGNYSYNTLKGIRCLSGLNNEYYNRFFNVPLFQENMDISQRTVSQSSIEIENEPDSPKGAKYWSYQTFRLVSGNTIYIDIGNWSIEFVPVSVQSYEAKYYYHPEIINKRKLGSWEFKIGEFKISFDFIRDSICYIINLILLFFQYLMYLVVASLSFIFMFLGCYIIAFLYNICAYYLYIGLLWVIWWIWVLLLELWYIIVWIWRNLIYPFLEWCYNVLLPIIIDGIIIVMAFLITVFIYILTLGQLDFWETYDMVYDLLWNLVFFIVDWIGVFGSNLEYILLFIIFYLICAVLIYFRYLYSRARGNINRAEQLYYTFQIYIAPIVFIWDLIRKLLEAKPNI